jgi:hypothetical protein
VDRRAKIDEALERDVCPQCGKPLAGDRVGTGSLADGVFCSLKCIAEFHSDYFEARRDWGTPTDN